MSNHSSARARTIEDDPVVRADLILIDSLVRDGRSEREIAAAVRERHAPELGLEPAQPLFRRVLELFSDRGAR